MTRDIRAIMRDLDRYCKSIADENLEEQSQEELKRNATAHPHHVWMARHMLEHFPEFKSLLEIGCRSGENLRLLHSINPDAHLMGIEKNYALAAHGNACFKEADIPITIAAGDPLVLDWVPDKSIDLVLADSILIDTPPLLTSKIIGEFARIARKGFIFLEWHTENQHIAQGNRWVYNYRQLLNSALPGAELAFIKLPPTLWGGPWGDHGYLILAKIPL